MMKKLILILLFVTPLANGLLNAQKLLFDKRSEPELNTNTSLDFSYTELVTNGELETLTSGTIDDGTSDDFADYIEGATSGITEQISSGYVGKGVKFTNNTGSTNTGLRLYQTITVSQNENYLLSFWAKGSGTQAGYYAIYNNTGAAYIQDYITTGITSATWTEKQRIFTTPAGCISIRGIITGHQTNGQVIYFDNISLKKLIAPTGFITPTMTATDYVIEDSGCKLVEVTGQTYIQMSDTLAAGYYKLKVTQDWTQGKLWAYNGTTTYNFPQSDGSYAVKIYLPGNKPLVIGCDNNTISVLSSLSIK